MTQMIRIPGGPMAAVFGVASLLQVGSAPAHARGDVVATLQSQPQYSTLVEAVGAAGLVETLQGLDDITVLAPTNAAFDAVPDDQLAALLGDPEALRRVLFYHVLPEEVRFSKFADGDVATALEGESVEVEVTRYFWFYRKVEVDGAQVVQRNIRASNGIIHGIDAVLNPDSGELPTLLEIALSDDKFSTVAGLVVDAGLVPYLKQERVDLTAFLPTNSAFEKIDPAALSEIAADRYLLRIVLRNHLAYGRVTSGDLEDGASVRTLSRNRLPVAIGDEITVGPAVVTMPDQLASNGVAHEIDTVLVPELPMSLIDVAEERDDLSLFVTAVGIAGLDSTLDRRRAHPKFTVFVPDNEAFNAIDPVALDALTGNPAELAEVLKLHVVAGEFEAADLRDGQKLKTLSGKTLNVAVSPAGVTINGVAVSEPDLGAANGVIHIVEEVLQEDAYTIADAVGAIPQLSTLSAAVDAADLRGALDDPSVSWTLLAPRNRAFDALPEDTVPTLLGNPGLLADILKYHVVPVEAEADVVATLESAPTLLGPDVEISVREFSFWFWNWRLIYVNGVAVIATDIRTDNGIIHVIDGVLDPPASMGEAGS